MDHPDNPTGYSFEYVIENYNPGGVTGTGKLKALQITSEPMSSLDVGYVVSSGIDPQQVGFFDTAGQKLTWQWLSGIGLGSKSATLVVHSPYKAYSLGPVTVAGDGTYQTFNNHFVAAVPEPSTYAGVFALGLAGFAAYRRFQA